MPRDQNGGQEFPADANILSANPISSETVEDLYEAVSTTVPQAKFGLAFQRKLRRVSDAGRGE